MSERKKTAPVGVHFREARGDPKLGPSFPWCCENSCSIIPLMLLLKFSQHQGKLGPNLGSLKTNSIVSAGLFDGVSQQPPSVILYSV